MALYSSWAVGGHDIVKRKSVGRSSCGNIKSRRSMNGTRGREHLPKSGLLSPFRLSAPLGRGSALALSKHGTFLAYQCEHRRRLDHRRVEEETESPRKFVILKPEGIMQRYWYIQIYVMFPQPSAPDSLLSFAVLPLLSSSLLSPTASLRAQGFVANAPFGFLLLSLLTML